MVLGKEVAAQTGGSARAAYRLIEKYTGADPAKHRWTYNIGERGAHRFELLPLGT
jgi:hypothetical protein